MEIQNYVAGKWCDAISKKKLTRTNPANSDEVVGHYPASQAEDIKKAIENAHAAFIQWRKVPAPQRASFVGKAINILRDNAQKIAHDLTLEQGKPLKESIAEVNRGLEEMEFFAGEARRIEGRWIPSARKGVVCYTTREPIGVICAVVPWNYPFIPAIRKITPALIFGNTVVLKPASLTPFTSAHITRAFADAGLPEGVLNLVIGSGSSIGREMVENPLVRGITFTGSTEIGNGIMQGASKHGAKLQLEMGGKNPAVVTETADLKIAAAQIVARAMSCTGQLCISISRVIVQESIYEKFCELLRQKIAEIVVGPGMAQETAMGPLVSSEHLQNVLSYVQKGVDEGAKLAIGGKRLGGTKYDKGHFIEPTMFVDVQPNHTIAQEEIFGPVLSVIKYKDFGQALEITNSVKYGLAACIYTNKVNEAMSFVAEAQAGMVQVNLPTYADAHAPFGGLKASGSGAHEVGYSCVDFCTDQKTVYIQSDPTNL